MNLQEKIQKIWVNRDSIAEGFYNAFLNINPEIHEEANRRLSICRSNQCGFYDKEGSSETVVVKGLESCGGCGCNLTGKTHAMSKWCYLKDIGKEPLWDSLMSHDDEVQINKKLQEEHERISTEKIKNGN